MVDNELTINMQMLDVTAPKVVKVRVRGDGRVLWVNIDGICRFRACQVETLIIEDDRYGMDSEAQTSDNRDAGMDT